MKKLKTILTSVTIAALGLCAVAASNVSLRRNDNPKLRVDNSQRARILTGQTASPGIAKPHKSRAFKKAGQVIKAPRKSNASGSTIYGYLGIDLGDNLAPGLYTVDLDLHQSYLGYTDEERVVAGAVVRDGKTSYYYNTNMWGYLFSAGFLEVDMATCEITDTEMDSSDYSNWVLNFAYSQRDNCYYGYNYKADASGIAFFSAPADNPTDITVISEDMPMAASITVNQITNEIVIITFDGEMQTIDPETGATEHVLSTDIYSYYMTGLCYSPYDGGYIWQTVEYDLETEDYMSCLYLIHDNKEVENLGKYPNAIEYLSFYCPDQKLVSDNAPANPTFIESNFPNGSLSGSVKWEMPTLTFGGTEISTALTYTVCVDDVEYTHGNAKAGEVITVEFDTLSEGRHYLSIVLAIGDDEGRSTGINLYVGNDTPCAPAEVDFTETEISWTPVTKGTHNGYIDLEALTYTVYVDDTVYAEGVKTTNIPFSVPEEELADHVAKVVAVCNGLSSEPTYSNAIRYGTPLNIPVYLAPDGSTALLFTIIDNNNDMSTWEYSEDFEGTGTFVFYYNDTNTGDDYLILPPIYLDRADIVYDFSFIAYARDAAYPEKLNVFMGTAPTAEAMTTQLMDTMTLTSNEETDVQVLFTVPEPGVYYLAVHAVSDPNKFRMYAQKFSVKESLLSPNGPKKIEDLTAIFGEKGALYADVTFTLPTFTIMGDLIPSDSEIIAEVSSPLESKKLSGKPGEKLTAAISTEQGVNTIEVKCYIDGVGYGQTVKVNVFTGPDAPGDVANLKITPSETGENAVMTWEPPTVGINGGYVDSEDVTYYLCMPVQWWWEIVGCIGTNILKCEVPVSDEGQYLVELGIISENSYGQAETVTSTYNIVGKPYSLPAKEVFKDGVSLYSTYLNQDENAYWGFYTPNDYLSEEYVNDGNVALIAQGNVPGATSRFQTPLFSTLAMKAASFTMEFHDKNASEFRVYMESYEKEPVLLYDAADHEKVDGYHEVTVSLPESMLDCGWVQLIFETTLDSWEKWLVINKWILREDMDHDLSVTAINGPMTFIIDGKSIVSAEVTNEGHTKEVVEAQWRVISSEDKPLMEVPVTGNKALVLDETETFTLEIEPTVDFGSNVSVEFVLKNGGENTSNDSMTMKAGISTGGKPMVTDLHIVSVNNETVDLEWSAPVLPTGNESFENERPNIDTPNMIAGFTNIDGDGVPVYDFAGWNFPCVGQPQGWFVWNVEQLNQIIGQDLYDTTDGSQLIAAFSPMDGTRADDWLISPEIKGGTKVSFNARPIDIGYGAENIEVMYSANGTAFADFEAVETIEVNVNEWREYSVTLPDDAKYFALHYVGTDNFGVLLDELKYILDSEAVAITGYDVLRNDVEEATNTALDCWYEATVPNQDEIYTFYVIPVLTDGSRGLRSNGVTFETTSLSNLDSTIKIKTGAGIITVTGAEGLPLKVVSASGFELADIHTATDSETISVSNGAYILSIGSKTVKVMVK